MTRPWMRHRRLWWLAIVTAEIVAGAAKPSLVGLADIWFFAAFLMCWPRWLDQPLRWQRKLRLAGVRRRRSQEMWESAVRSGDAVMGLFWSYPLAKEAEHFVSRAHVGMTVAYEGGVLKVAAIEHSAPYGVLMSGSWRRDDTPGGGGRRRRRRKVYWRCQPGAVGVRI